MPSTGRPRKVTDESIISVIDNRDGFLITTAEVGRVLDIDRRTAAKRLEGLEQHGFVKGERFGNTTGVEVARRMYQTDVEA